MNNNLVQLISRDINLCLKDTIDTTKIIATQPKSKISGPLNQFTKQLEKLNKKRKLIENNIEQLEKIVACDCNEILAAPRSTTTRSTRSTKKVIEQLDENLNLLDSTYEDYKQSKEILARIEMSWGKNRNASGLLREARATVEKFEQLYERAKTALTKLAKTQRPAILTGKSNELIRSVLKWMDSQIEEVIELNPRLKEEPEIDKLHSIYMMDSMNTQVTTIRFARYIPMYNIPTIDGKTKDLYAVFMVDLYSPRQRNGLLTSSNFSNIMMTFTNDIVTPKKAPKVYVIKSLRDARNIMEFMAQKQGLIVFGSKISGDANSRREKVIEKLTVLNDKSIKVQTDGPFVKVTIPQAKAKLAPNGDLEKKFDKDLYVDIKHIVGLPVSTESARYTTDRLKKEKTVKNRNGSITITYRVLQMKPSQDLIDPINQKSKTGEDIPETVITTNEDWINELRKQASQLM